MPLQRPFFLFLGFIFSCSISFAKQMPDASIVPANDSISTYSSLDYISNNRIEIADSVINYGKLFLNRPYRYGSQGADSFDCSGFTSYVYRNFGYNLGHSSAEQANQFDTVKRTNLKRGDLVYFAGSRKSKRVGHVGIVTAAHENGQFDFIHASCDHGVTISSSEEPYYSRRYITANRVIGGSQLLAVNSSSLRGADPDPEEVAVPMSVPSKKIKKTIPAKFHKVKSGETLSEIAEKYGLTVSELKRMNGLKSTKISLKQNLKVKNAEKQTVVEPVQTAATKKPDSQNKLESSPVKQVAEVAGAQTVTHKVKRGETLYSISKEYGITTDELKKLNNIESGKKIVPGQEIKVSMTVAGVKPAQAQTPSQITEKLKSHKVASGESLYSIAKMYNVTVDDLKKINDIPSNGIHAGQVLKIAVSEDKSVAVNNATAPVVAPKPEAKIENKPIARAEVVVAKKEAPVKQQELVAKTEIAKEEPRVVSAPEVKPDVNPKPGSTVKILNHKVHAGESLVTIARDFKVSLDELQRINNMEGTKLSVGQEIFIVINTEPAVAVPAQVSALPISKKAVRPANEPVAEVEPLQVSEAKPKTESKVKPDSKPKQEAKSQQEAKPVTYKVKKGDNLNIIAEKYNLSIDELKKLNDLSGTKINVGQELTIASDGNETEAKGDVVLKSEPAKTLTHKVRKHETLSSIAKDFNMTVGELKDINGLSGNKVHTGQKLVVSQLTSEKEKSVTSKSESKAKSQKTQKHKVKSGDSFYSIAHKYNCSVNDLKEWNPKKSTKLQPGDVLVIKSGK